jgi:hypothetical protein
MQDYETRIVTPAGTVTLGPPSVANVTLTKLTHAEADHIALLRSEAAKNFAIEIRNADGFWYAKLTDQDAHLTGYGQGDTFSTAWDDMLHRSLRSRRAAGEIQGSL